MSNIETLSDFIKKKAPNKVRKEWFLWALKLLKDGEGKLINPKYLELSVNVTGRRTEWHTHAGTVQDSEPLWK